MEPQNSNQTNGNEQNTINNSVPIHQENNNVVSTPEMVNSTTQMNLAAPTNIEPIKPTLDSILNGPTNEPANVMENTLSENLDTAVVDNSAQNYTSENSSNNSLNVETLEAKTNAPIEPVSNMVNEVHEGPIMETIDDSTSQNSETIAVSSPTIENLNSNDKVIASETIENEINEQPIEMAQVYPNSIPEQPVETDDFNQVPAPPVFEDEKAKRKKQGGQKIIILILIIILIAAIGFGVYYFLTMAKDSSTRSITTKDVKIELGSTLSSDIDTYASISGYNKKDCQLDLNNVNTNKVSTYKYKVTCGNTSEEGIVIVDDTTKPEVVVNDLILLPNATLNAEDFIEKCIDVSKCSYTFKTDVSGLTRDIGEYQVEIIVSDEYNNQNIVTANLTIARTAPARYLTCTKTAENVEDISATLVDGYRIGIDANDNFYNATRNSEFTFENKNDYNKIKTDYNETEGIHSIRGKVTFNDNKMSIIIKENKTLEDMNKELNGRLPNNSNILRAFLSGLGYKCN